MLDAIVLGSAAGGGLPQWNCRCPVCRAAWDDPQLRNGQASVAITADGGANWFLINASPDLRQQILDTPSLHPRDGLRHSPIAGVILTNGEVDAIAGLLSLREGWPFAIYAHPRVLAILAANSLFNVLAPSRVPRRPIVLGEPFEPLLQDGTPSGLVIEAFPVPGKPALYLEENEETDPGDTIGLCVRDRGATSALVFVPACAEVDAPLAERLRGAPLVFFDGTLWTDDEMTRTDLGPKSGRRMGHMPISGAGGTLDRLSGLDIGRKVLIHMNNSNPVLLPDSPERREVEVAGWCVALPGMEVRP